MFDRKYTVKIYNEGQSTPILEFSVYCQRIAVSGHVLIVDGMQFFYSKNHFIAIDN